ncbi:60S ribosomal protein L34 [Tanacetum coccineum]
MRLTLNFHHDGNFVPSPLMYQEGDESTIHDIKFEGMTVARLSKMLQGTCMFPVKGILFLVPGKELSNGLIQIKNDLDLANCIAIGYKNGKVIDVFLEHHGYDLSHWIQTDIDNNDDENSDVEMEDITGYAANDFVGEDDVVIPNRSINDPFLNKLCNGSYINDFSDKPDVGESSQPCGKELEIDSDDEDVDKQFKLVDGVIYPEFDPKLPWNEMKPTLGLRFEHPEQLKDCLTNYGVANGYQLWYRRNDYRSLFVLCGRDLAEGRSSGKKGKKGKDEDELPKKDKGLLLRSPKKGRLIEHYSRLWDYRKQLLDTNPGSLAMIEGWNAGCRKVIGLDGCFKGTCRGELLTAMGRDGNNQMFPIAWDVVNVENTDNWEWFLGLMEAIKNLLPYAEHRQCARHIYANFKKKWNGLHFKSLFWGAATSTVHHNFYTKLNLIGNINPKAKQCITPSIRKEIERLKHSQRYWTVYPCGDNVFEVRKGDDSYGVNIENRTCACKWWDLSGVPCVHSVAAFSFLKNDPILGVSAWYSKKMWQNAYSYFIKPVGGSSMWPQTREEPPLPPVLKDSAGPSVADPSSAGPSVADSTSSGTQAATVTEDPIVADPTDDIPTQQSKTSDTAKIIEDAIVTGRLKTAGLKRRCKSERIAKRAKAYQFGKDGARSCSEKAWDVDEVLAEK